nr:Uncharacterized protein/Odorant-binding related protein [Metisa plana]
MLGKVVLLAVGVIVCLGDAKDMKECGKIFHPRTSRCCKTSGVKLNIGDGIRECFEEHKGLALPSSDLHEPPPCDLDKCLAEKRGILNDQGSIDKDKLKNVVQTEFSSRPALLKKIIDNCIEGDASKYAPADFCELIKMRNCILVQACSECTDWDNTDENCKEMKELVVKCES